MAGIYRNWDAGDYTAVCRKFDLPPDKKYKDYSAGMQRKLCIAVALAHHPKLLLLDEATSGLDPVVRDEVTDMLLDFARDEDHSILISSHIVSDLEKLCDTIAFLHKGRLLLCEEKDALREEYALWHGTAAQLAALDARVYGKEQGHQNERLAQRMLIRYGPKALFFICILRALPMLGMAYGAELAPVSIEELFVLMVKGEIWHYAKGVIVAAVVMMGAGVVTIMNGANFFIVYAGFLMGMMPIPAGLIRNSAQRRG